MATLASWLARGANASGGGLTLIKDGARARACERVIGHLIDRTEVNTSVTSAAGLCQSIKSTHHCHPSSDEDALAVRGLQNGEVDETDRQRDREEERRGWVR